MRKSQVSAGAVRLSPRSFTKNKRGANEVVNARETQGCGNAALDEWMDKIRKIPCVLRPGCYIADDASHRARHPDVPPVVLSARYRRYLATRDWFRRASWPARPANSLEPNYGLPLFSCLARVYAAEKCRLVWHPRRRYEQQAPRRRFDRDLSPYNRGATWEPITLRRRVIGRIPLVYSVQRRVTQECTLYIIE